MSAKRYALRKSLPLLTTLSLILPVLLALAAPVSAATVTVCATGCDYTTIQAAVNAANAGDVIHVYPGTYDEGVDLAAMDPEGDLTLITVNNSGTPTPGTVTVDNSGDDSEFYTSDWFEADLTIDGFNLSSLYSAIDVQVDGNVVIRNVNASGTGGDGIAVSAYGNVTISGCTTNNNQGPGISLYEAGGDVTITGCTANQNTCPPDASGFVVECTAHGIAVLDVSGKITIDNCTANGNGGSGIFVAPEFVPWLEPAANLDAAAARVSISNCYANSNGRYGIDVIGAEGDVAITNCTTNTNVSDGVFVSVLADLATGPQMANAFWNVTIKNCTANGNDQSGFDPEMIYGTLTIDSCIARDNEHGVDLDGLWSVQAALVNGSIICGNECGLLLEGDVPGLNAEGNWWGCEGGPEAVGCDPICQYDSIPVDFTPWIDSVTGSAGTDPATVGSPTLITFWFSGGPPAVYLGQGPGDLRGPAPFTVSTDNGTLNGAGATVNKFITGADGTLNVTLVPASEGTATVGVIGPCGLEGEVVLGVLAAEVREEFVPEPGSMVLLASGLMGLAGYAGLRWRRR